MADGFVEIRFHKMLAELKRRVASLALSILPPLFVRLPYNNRLSRLLDLLLCIEEGQRIK